MDSELHFIAHFPAGSTARTFAARLLNEVGCAAQEEHYIRGIAECCGCGDEERERVISRAIDCKLIRPELLQYHARGRTRYIPCLVGVP